MQNVYKKPVISIVIPVYNESAGIDWFHSALLESLHKYSEYSFELVYINDGSSDDSLHALCSLKAPRSYQVQIINFSRNFGKEAALSAGYRCATGDAALSIDSDGQHPIDTIREFLDEWNKGADVVIGIRGKNQKEGVIKHVGSKLFYSIFNKLTGVDMVPRSTDFRLIDRKVINELNKLQEGNRITRGLIDWLGFRRSYVDFDAEARKFGTAGYTLKKLVQLAMNTFVSLSAVPLFLSGYLGIFFMLVSFGLGLFILIEQVIMGDPMGVAFTGTAMLGVLTTFLVGTILAGQGLVGLYISRILNESQKRPLYVISSIKKL